MPAVLDSKSPLRTATRLIVSLEAAWPDFAIPYVSMPFVRQNLHPTDEMSEAFITTACVSTLLEIALILGADSQKLDQFTFSRDAVDATEYTYRNHPTSAANPASYSLSRGRIPFIGAQRGSVQLVFDISDVPLPVLSVGLLIVLPKVSAWLLNQAKILSEIRKMAVETRKCELEIKNMLLELREEDATKHVQTEIDMQVACGRALLGPLPPNEIAPRPLDKDGQDLLLAKLKLDMLFEQMNLRPEKIKSIEFKGSDDKDDEPATRA